MQATARPYTTLSPTAHTNTSQTSHFSVSCGRREITGERDASRCEEQHGSRAGRPRWWVHPLAPAAYSLRRALQAPHSRPKRRTCPAREFVGHRGRRRSRRERVGLRDRGSRLADRCLCHQTVRRPFTTRHHGAAGEASSSGPPQSTREQRRNLLAGISAAGGRQGGHRSRPRESCTRAGAKAAIPRRRAATAGAAAGGREKVAIAVAEIAGQQRQTK